VAPLSGVRVLDFTIWRPGPYATQLLCELGADVLKVEPPTGDPMRSYPGLFAALNAGKRGIALDLKDGDARAEALALAAEADVVVESYRPGVAERLGISAAAVRAVQPDVVYCSVSGMGQTGPLAQAPGHDLNYMAWAGALAPDGELPRVPAIPVADLSGGMAAALSVCAALVGRARGGAGGERIDVAIGDVLATWTGAVVPEASGVDPAARQVPGYGLFETADGHHVALGVLTEDHFWRSLCAALGLEPGTGELSFVDRMARTDELHSSIGAAVRQRPRDELVAALLAADVPVAPVNTRAEMLALDHFRERGVVGEEEWAEVATGHPVKFDRQPPQRRGRPPELGEHAGQRFQDR
jgi:crotonobetainyl-CoA:carnitine CoA-transferase CaiB-like acyl-CoA transferase